MSYTASGMRQNIYEQNGFRIYADCYNASPDAMEATLGVLGTMGDTGRRIAVLGSMLELGDYTKEGHRRAGEPPRSTRMCSTPTALRRMPSRAARRKRG